MSELDRLGALDLNLLIALDALLAEQSVTRAAERLSLSQPATSAALKRLRAQFDDELLVREGQRMVATDFARGLRTPLHEALEQLAATLAARPAFDPATDTRHFRVFANDYMCAVLLGPLITGLLDTAPGVSLEVITATQRVDVHLLDTFLHDERLDFVLAAGDFPEADRFPSEPLFADDFIAIAGAGVPRLGRRLTATQLATLPYVAYRQSGASSFADDELDRAGLARRTVLTVESFLLVPHVLAHTTMISMLQRRLCAALDLDGVVQLEPPLALHSLRERMYWHPRSSGDPAHRWLRERLAEVGGEANVAATPRPTPASASSRRTRRRPG